MALYACVLAGGRSSRMGQDKAALVLEGQSLLERALVLLQQVQPDHILVSGRPAHPFGIADVLPDCGPPGALYAILEYLAARQALDQSSLLLIPVDMPLLKVASLQTVLAEAGEVEACHYEGEVFPCVIKASSRLHGYLQALFAEARGTGGKRSMKAVFRWLGASTLPVTAELQAQFRNVNTPGEWQALQLTGC